MPKEQAQRAGRVSVTAHGTAHHSLSSKALSYECLTSEELRSQLRQEAGRQCSLPESEDHVLQNGTLGRFVRHGILVALGQDNHFADYRA
jgi:hypothetical protein